jgi:hypothetical protein
VDQDEMGPTRDPATLARRLRELRERHWPGDRLTQPMLAEAFGLKVPTISGWENERNIALPPEQRLRAYATLFATRRSLQDGRLRLVPEDDLREEERAACDRLYAELLELRSMAVTEASAAEPSGPPIPRHGLWYFPNLNPIRLVCGPLDIADKVYTDRLNPNYTEILGYADADAMVELFGHVRMENPSSDVRFRLADELVADDLTAHLVLIGGVFFNRATRWIGAKIKVPVEQVKDDSVEDGEVFEVEGKRFLPSFSEEPSLGVVEDTGLLFRTRNPNNRSTTLTICNGTFSRGVLGSVRCLTDREMRDQNEAYLAEHFSDAAEFGVLMRVPVLRGKVATPDLTNPENRRFEWST